MRCEDRNRSDAVVYSYAAAFYRSIKLPSPESESRTRAGVRRRVRPQFAGRTLGWAGSSPTGLLAGGGPWKLGAPCDRPARSPRSTGLAAGHAGDAVPLHPPRRRAARRPPPHPRHLRGVEAGAGDRRAPARHHRVAAAV